MNPHLIAIIMEGEEHTGGGRLSKGSAVHRARESLKHAKYKEVDMYGPTMAWYGQADNPEDAYKQALESLTGRAGFIVCDVPEKVRTDAYIPTIMDDKKFCLSNKEGSVYVVFDRLGGAIIL
jgi:hypothetical protein